VNKDAKKQAGIISKWTNIGEAGGRGEGVKKK